MFTVTSIAEKQARDLLCFDRNTGRLLWQKTVVNSPLEKKHSLNSHASSTPATDGKLVYVAFLDRNEMVVAAHDFEGNRKWLVRPGAFSSMHGFRSSPILYKELVIVNGDHDGDGYMVALRRDSGRGVEDRSAQQDALLRAADPRNGGENANGARRQPVRGELQSGEW